MAEPWRIQLLGGLRVQRGQDPPVRFDTRHTAALLAYLAYFDNRPHSREVVAEQLWPDEEMEATRSRLRTALWALRRTLEPDGTPPGTVLLTDLPGLRLAPAGFTSDVMDFSRALHAAAQSETTENRAQSLCHAVDVYAGDLLPGSYAEWIAPERERLAEAHRLALSQAAGAIAACGDMAGAVEYARRAVSVDPLQEQSHAHLIELYIRAGRTVDAIRQYQELERILRTEMGLKPTEATRALLNTILDSRSSTDLAAQAERSRCVSQGMTLRLESEGGAVRLDSEFYIERKTDALFADAVRRQDSIVLVKGARQMGKSSLLARGLQRTREAGIRVVLTDLQKISSEKMETSDGLFLALAREIADELDLDVTPDEAWHASWGANVNFERFLRREVLKKDAGPFLWGLDEVDRLFGLPYTADVFGLFRSWHNARSLNPDGPWMRLTMAIAYATEAHLFITDLNQSPFNVGTRLSLDDFTPGEVAELNRRYHSPLQNEDEIRRYMGLVGGQPYLVRRGLHTMISDGLTIDQFEAAARQVNGIFADHLNRMGAALAQDPELTESLRAVLTGRPCPSNNAFLRLQSAGVLIGGSLDDARPRCQLYQTYLASHLV